MAGHSQFKNIMYRKGAQDAKRAKQFAKISREISVAVRTGGADPAANPRLRIAIMNARSLSMPKDNIERAIKKGEGGSDGLHYEEFRYEGYGPGATAFIVEVLTDNRNRTASEVRTTFAKYGGNMGEAGSVAFMFTHCGLMTYPLSIASAESMFERALEAGSEDIVSDTLHHEIYTSPEALHQVVKTLEGHYGEPLDFGLVWRTRNETVPQNLEEAAAIIKLASMLEDLDDVQKVFGNFSLSEEMIERLNA